MTKYPGNGYKPRPRKEIEAGECPSIHCRFKPATFNRICEIAEQSEQPLNKTLTTLVELILPYIEIREVTTPRIEIIVNFPDKEGE